MFRDRTEQVPGLDIIFHWFLLSFNGGFINAGGFLSTGRFVSHVTGFATLFGVELAVDRVAIAVSLLTVPLFFLMGSLIAGLMIERPIANGKKPHFDFVMGLGSLCLLVAANGDKLKLGEFGEILGLGAIFLLMALLCLACGLQNGAITSSSVKSVRTTHLTGVTTDLGLGFARLISLDRRTEPYKKEVRANLMRSGSIVFFVIGSAVGAYVFYRYGYTGFYIPALIMSYAAWHGRNAKLQYVNPTSA